MSQSTWSVISPPSCVSDAFLYTVSDGVPANVIGAPAAVLVLNVKYTTEPGAKSPRCAADAGAARRTSARARSFRIMLSSIPDEPAGADDRRAPGLHAV